MANSEPLLGADTAYVEVGPDDEDPVLSTGGGLRQRRQTVVDSDVDKNFFAWGRDFESAKTAHQFTREEQVEMKTNFESNNYFPANSEVYRAHLGKQEELGEAGDHWTVWLAMGLIGCSMGMISFFVRQTVDVISEGKYKTVEPMVDKGNWFEVWIVTVMYSLLFILISVSLVIFIEPAAASSGIPEVIAYLNGVHVKKIFNAKTLIVKFFSVICSVGSGYPVGPEGPMIHMGGIVGAGVSQGRSSTLGVDFPVFERFRNVKSRRDFITGGVACGVAAAFGAPVGGLLFAMEEVASFWSQRLGWIIFFGTMCAVFMSDVWNSSFEGYKYLKTFGSFDDKNTILYEVTYDVSMHIVALFPTIACGLLGGFFGTVFTVMNLKISRWRKKNIAPNKYMRILDVVVIMIIYSSLTVFIPKGFDCVKATNCSYVPYDLGDSLEPPEDETFYYQCMQVRDVKAAPSRGYFPNLPSSVKRYQCKEKELVNVLPGGIEVYDIEFNDMATLMFNSGEASINQLFSRGTAGMIGYGALFTMLIVYFIAACSAMGTAVSAGVVVPMLLIGGCYGRIVGNICVDIVEWHGGPWARGDRWAWADPGVFALIGAASFFGGVSRLTLSLTVIMVEISNDIHMLLMIMVTIMVSKWISDNVTHSLYHSLIELKCMPFLNDEIPNHTAKGYLHMDRYQVSKIMQTPVVTVHQHSPVDDIRELLNPNVSHNAFPVVSETAQGNVIVGMILKSTLREILRHPDLFRSAVEPTPAGRIPYPRIQASEFSEKHSAIMRGKIRMSDDYSNDEPVDDDVYRRREDGLEVDLGPYMDQSPFTVLETFSVQRAYDLFRTMGLRHLPVVNKCNTVVGILTRKDMQGHDIAHALEHDDDHGHHH
mmetsp:Transcript_5905/g.17678  ORF Transcript_5905/g.17678 Transcript_5905/m.17678 type:complete len:877 (-) Transcript_5905:85-2715(-)